MTSLKQRRYSKVLFLHYFFLMYHPKRFTGGIILMALALLGAGCASQSNTETPRNVPTAPTQGTQPQQQQPAQRNQPQAQTPTQLPSNVPSDVPAAPNSTIINTSVDSTGKNVRVLMSSPDQSDRVLAAIAGQLTANGFTQKSDSTASNTRLVIFKKGNVTMGINLIQEIDVTNYEVSREEGM